MHPSAGILFRSVTDCWNQRAVELDLMQVNMKKVNMDVMQRWIAQRITSLLGFEDDIVVGTCVNYLAEEVRPILKSNMHLRWPVPFGLHFPLRPKGNCTK